MRGRRWLKFGLLIPAVLAAGGMLVNTVLADPSFQVSPWDVQLRPVEGTSGPNQNGTAAQITPGETVELRVTYNNSTTQAGVPVYTYVNVDSNYSSLTCRTGDSPCSREIAANYTNDLIGNPVNDSGYDSYTYSTFPSGTVIDSNGAIWPPGSGGSGTDVSGQPNCYSGGDADGSKMFVDNPSYMPPYQPSPKDTGYWASCGQQGFGLMWKQNDTHTTGHWTFRFTVSPDAKVGTTICMRAHVDHGGSGPSSTIGVHSLGRVRAVSGDYCYEVYRATITGKVTSDPVNATGKPLANVPIQYLTSCNSAYQTTFTGPDGVYSFVTKQGCTLNIAPPNPLSNAGTNYNSPNPLLYSGQACFQDTCGGYNFVYQPIPVAPSITKTETAVNSTAVNSTAFNEPVVKPGDTIYYKVVADNPLDANLDNTLIADNIPLNLDPTSVTLDSVSVNGDGATGEPPTWAFGIPIDRTACFLGVPFSFGWWGIQDGNGNLQNTSATCSQSVGAGTTPPYLKVALGKMPAYSTLTFTFHGKVKGYSAIGVYPGAPGDYRTCNGSTTYDGTNTTYLPNCEDFSVGLEGVSNYATAQVDAVMLPSYSNQVYNPIPGAPPSVTKSCISVGVGVCTLDVAGDAYDFDPTNRNYNTANMAIIAAVDTSGRSGGPIFLAARDQAGGASLSYMQVTGCPGSITCNPLPVTSGPEIWHDLNNPPTSYSTWATRGSYGSSWAFQLDVTFTNSAAALPLGTKVCNSADAIWHDYSTVGYPQQSSPPSNAICFKRSNIQGPTLAAQNGNVYAGGRVVTPNSVTCGNNSSAPVAPYVATNAGSTGGLAVGSFSSISGIASPLSSSNYATICRKDAGLALPGSSAGPINTAAAVNGINNSAANDGKWVTGVPNLHIGGFAAKGRWTLYVPGDLYIDGDITGTGSLGIIADNIYISKDVSNINAFLFAGRSSIPGSGVIDTCAKDLGGGFAGDLASGAYSASECSLNTLTVNGFMMARKFNFYRLNTAHATGSTETVKLGPLLLSLTPPGFSDLGITSGNTNFTGELPPRY